MGTANRQGPGARMGTAAQPYFGVGALTEVKVSERPMTMQGVSGLKTGSIGPKRQIYDKTYYMVELRRKCTELMEEVARLNKEINDITQDNATYATLEKRCDSLVKTVRALEGDLADHNLATDKQRTDTRPEEVHHMYMIMESQNKQQRSDVDQIFLEKRSHEEEIGRMEMEINAIARQAEERLSELHPDQRREYEVLREESHRLSSDLADARDDLDQVNSRLNTLESRLRSDVLRTRYQQLGSVHNTLHDRLMGLEREVMQGSMSVPEQRELLLNKVKSDNGDIVAAEKGNYDMKLDNERLRAQIREVTADAEERNHESGEQQKYELLFVKDQEMSQFIEGFDRSKEAEEQKVKEKQANIVRLLDNISKALALSAEITPEGHLRDMEDELEFKARQLQNSETTQNRLEGELSKREGELEKINSLDSKISIELQQVEEKMRMYQDEIDRRLDKVSDMMEFGQRHQQRLEEQKQKLSSRVAVLKQQVGFLKLRFDSKRQQLADDTAAANIQEKEKKISEFGERINMMKSFIDTKGAESNFGPNMTAVLDMATYMNKILVDLSVRPLPMHA